MRERRPNQSRAVTTVPARTAAAETVAVIALVAAVFAAAVLLAPRLRLDDDIAALLPDNDPLVDDYQLVMESFSAAGAVCIDVGLADQIDPGLADQSAGTEDDLTAVADSFHRELQQSGLFKNILYRFNPSQLEALFDVLGPRAASLTSADDLRLLEQRSAPDEVARRLRQARNRLIEPSGLVMQAAIRRDPLGFGDVLAKKLSYLGGETGGAGIRDGRIRSRDGLHLLMVAEPKSPATDAAHSAELVELVERARDTAQAAAPAGTVQIAFVGQHRGVVENTRTIKADVQRAVSATSVGIAILGLLFFRRKLYVLLVFLPAVFGIACGMILFALVWPGISAIAVGCGAALIGIAVDYGIHLMYMLDGTNGELTARDAARRLRVPLTMACLTTALAALCLLLSSLPGQRQMGVFAAVGVVGAAVFAAVALPRFVPPIRRKATRFTVPLVEGCAAMLAWRQRHGTAAAALLAAVIVAGIAGLTQLELEGDVTRLDYNSPQRLHDENLMRVVWQDFFQSTSVVVRGGTFEQALEANDRLFDLLRRLADSGRIESFASISPVLPSPTVQAANRRRWREYWSADRLADFQAAMGRAMAELKFSPGAFQPFMDGLAQPGEAAAPDDFADTIIGPGIASRIAVRPDGEYLVLSTLRTADDSRLAGAISEIRGVVPDAVILNKRQFVQHMGGFVLAELWKFAIPACCMMLIVLYLSLRRIELTLIGFLPVCLSVLLTLGALGLLGLPINMISCLFIVIIFGAGIDYSIFLLSSALAAYRGEDEREASTCGSVTICSLTTICGFVTLALAKHPGLFSVGVTASIGMVASLGTAAVVVPGLAGLLLRDGGRRGTPTARSLPVAAWVAAFLVGHGLFYIVFVRTAARLRYGGNASARQKAARRFIQRMAARLLRWSPYRSSRNVFLNAEPAQFETPAVVVSNHLSAFDIMAVLALPTEMVMGVKRWVWKTPLMGTVVRDAGYILMTEGNADAFMDAAAALLREGTSVMVFPEGSRSPDGRMHRFHKGAFELAVRTSVDVLPVLLTNTQSCIPKGAFWVSDHSTIIRVLPRVTAQSCRDADGSAALARLVRDRMREFEQADWRLAMAEPAFPRIIRLLYAYRGAAVESNVRRMLASDSVCRQVDEWVPQTGDVLDVGCGVGAMSNILAWKSLGRRVLGIDYDEHAVAVAARTVRADNAVNVRFEQHDLNEWDYPQSDAVILVNLPRDWPAERRRQIARKAWLCLRPGGVLVCRTTGRADDSEEMLREIPKTALTQAERLPVVGSDIIVLRKA